ncbi:MAG: NfeD family protein [Thermodesulfobacteriota bacterium]
MKSDLFLSVLAVLLISFPLPPDLRAEDPGDIFIISISDPIGPGVSGFVVSGIEQANAETAECLILLLDTPGGLVDAMRDIVQAVLGSGVPVVVYVAPPGARAASAGVLITLAADIAAMAPGTNIGAAHPVGAGGAEMEGPMADKVLNDMAAYARTLAERRGRNVEWAEKAVRESVSATENEALEEGIIDLIAADPEDLIQKLDGRPVAGKGKLNLQNARRVSIEPNFRNQVLKAVSDPNIAFILLMIGLAGLYFELAQPGAIFPGVIGGISLILAFFALQTLPVNYAGVLLIIAGLVLFLLEIKITSYGLLSLAGIGSLFLGSLMLFENEMPGFRLSWSVLITTVAMFSGFFIAVVVLVCRSQFLQPKTGADGLIGQSGEVREALSPRGKVFIHGETWNAVSQTPVLPGEVVRVIGVKGLLLEVQPLTPIEMDAGKALGPQGRTPGEPLKKS